MHAHNFKDLTGQRFGRLVAQKSVKKEKSKDRAYSWVCICDCGSTATVHTSHLSTGHTKSCGCAQLEATRKAIGFSSRQRTLRDYKTKANTRGFSWNLSDEQFLLLTAGKCHYCGLNPSNCCAASKNGSFTYSGIDRVDNAMGYTLENTVSCCKVCNWAKRDRTQEEFLAWAERVVNYARNSKWDSSKLSSMTEMPA